MERYEFDLDQEMLKELLEEFDAFNFVNGLKLANPKNIASASGYFKNYGEKLAIKSIEKGQERPDRIYEVMKKAIEKTGEMDFPLIPQRYIEIAYLSIQPIKRLWILSNNHEIFSYKVNDCNLYKAIEKEFGEETAKKMACKEACFAIIEEVFSYFGFNVGISHKATIASDGKCQFKIEKMNRFSGGFKNC